MTGPAQLDLFAACTVAPQVDAAGPTMPALFERARRLALSDPALLLADDLAAALRDRLNNSGGSGPDQPRYEWNTGGITYTAPAPRTSNLARLTVARFTYAELAASIRPTPEHVDQAHELTAARLSMIEDEFSDPAGASPSEWARLASRDRYRIEEAGRALCARVLAENEQGALRDRPPDSVLTLGNNQWTAPRTITHTRQVGPTDHQARSTTP